MTISTLTKTLILLASLTQVFGSPTIGRTRVERSESTLGAIEADLFERQETHPQGSFLLSRGDEEDVLVSDLKTEDGTTGTTLWQRTTTPGSAMTYTNIAASGEYGGGFWYQEVVTTTDTTATDDAVYAAAKTGWTNSVAKATAAKKPAAAIGCALFIPTKAWILDTSLKAVGQDTQSKQTCDVVTDFMHKNWANCAEMNALAIMKQKSWSIPSTGAKMACYGNYGKAGTKAKWVKPCTEDANGYPGCKETIEANTEWKNIDILPAKPDPLAV